DYFFAGGVSFNTNASAARRRCSFPAAYRRSSPAERMILRPAFSSPFAKSSNLARYAAGSAAISRDSASLTRQSSSRIGSGFMLLFSHQFFGSANARQAQFALPQ